MLPQFQVPSILLGLFLRKLEVSDFNQLAESLPWRLPEFDGQPQLNQGLPPNAGPDIPRVAFSSRDRRRVLELAPAKLQFRMMPGELVPAANGQFTLKITNFDESMNVFKPAALRIQSVLSEHYGLTATRVGMLIEFLAPTGTSANQRMHQHFLSGKNFFGERLHEVGIQALSRVSLGSDGGRQVNRWIRVRSVRSNDPGAQDVALAVEADINTLPEDTYDITAVDLESFFENVRKHLNERVPLFNDDALFKG